MSISTLVLGGKQVPTDVSGLWDQYRKMVSRSRAEASRLQRELEIAGDGAIVSVTDMFALPEAYTADRWPTVALAPINSAEIRFTYQEHGRTGFHKKERLSFEDFDLPVTAPKAPEYTEAELEAQRREWTAMLQYSSFGWRMSGKADHTGSVKVPLVPSELMPKFGWLKRKVRAADYWVMFDSPVWKPEALPVDPYLLERMDATRFRVLSHWDLTPKELQLMALIR